MDTKDDRIRHTVALEIVLKKLWRFFKKCLESHKGDKNQSHDLVLGRHERNDLNQLCYHSLSKTVTW